MRNRSDRFTPFLARRRHPHHAAKIKVTACRAPQYRSGSKNMYCKSAGALHPITCENQNRTCWGPGSPPHHVREPKPHVLGARLSTPSRARAKTARAGGPGSEGNARALYGHFGKAFPVCMQSVRELRQSVLAYRFKQEGQKRKQIEKSKTKSDVIILRVWKGTRS